MRKIAPRRCRLHSVSSTGFHLKLIWSLIHTHTQFFCRSVPICFRETTAPLASLTLERSLRAAVTLDTSMTTFCASCARPYRRKSTLAWLTTAPIVRLPACPHHGPAMPKWARLQRVEERGEAGAADDEGSREKKLSTTRRTKKRQLTFTMHLEHSLALLFIPHPAGMMNLKHCSSLHQFILRG